jgi:hypothetical protein
MIKQIVIAGVAGVALFGGGAIAMAAESPGSTATGSTSATVPSTSSPTSSVTSASSSSASSSTPKANTPKANMPKVKADRVKQAVARLKNFDHAEWVTGPAGKSVTHDAIKGTVASVSATSIQVKAADGTTVTYGVGSSTKVGLREGGKGSAKKGTIAEVKSGDTVLVTGTKSGSTLSAAGIADTGTK